ncbi:MAG: tetratricopeptide repeat protein [Sphingobacteriales bacterium]
MSKNTCLFFVLFCFFLSAKAATPGKRDSLLKILHTNDTSLRKRQLVLYLRYYFNDLPPERLDAVRIETDQLLERYQITDRVAIGYFTKTLCLMQLQQYPEAESVLIQAIALADKNNDDYLLYACFTHLGFIQTYQGNITDAISSFRMAKKKATDLNDDFMQVVIDINISDIFYKINLYNQSLFYLKKAQSLMGTHHITTPKTRNAIINNVAECYFRMGNIDSLKKYNMMLNATKTGMYSLYTYRQRTDYYLDLLQHNYQAAIYRLQQLRKDSRFGYESSDEQNLADAYFMTGQPNSAKAIMMRLLADKAQNNHPEVKMHLYEILGRIAEKDKTDRLAAIDYKQALQQAEEQIGRMTRLDTISSQIKLDEMESTYVQRTERYKREQLWMGFTIIVSVLGLIIVALSYRHIRRKKYYEQLLFTAKKEELAFINSHEVRRHLSNILGIIDTIKHSEDKHQAYVEAEQHLLSATGDLDSAIRNISAKLDD